MGGGLGLMGGGYGGSFGGGGYGYGGLGEGYGGYGGLGGGFGGWGGFGGGGYGRGGFGGWGGGGSDRPRRCAKSQKSEDLNFGVCFCDNYHDAVVDPADDDYDEKQPLVSRSVGGNKKKDR